MVQGSIKKDTRKSFNRKKSEHTIKYRKKNFSKLADCLRVKWKLITTASLLLTSIFVLSGIVLYINIQALFSHKEKLNVHIIPYISSNWKYDASPESCFENELQKTLNFVLDELGNDNRRKFTITETFHIWKWWKNQDEEVKKKFTHLIESGRIEISGGGWCTTDEALVHYRTFIDQFTLGLRRLEEIIGRPIVPDVCFLIDNHGHSNEIASLLKQMDFSAIMLGGISPREQCFRKIFRKMEFLWCGDEDFDADVMNKKPNIYTSILDETVLKINSYFAYDNPAIDTEEFARLVFCQRLGYDTNNIFIPVGGDCLECNNFRNIFRLVDSLIDLTRNNSELDLNVIYSTPSKYLNSVLSSNGFRFMSSGKFLPYDEGKNEFWTGYYSSRPTVKYLERKTNGFLEVFKQILCVADEKMKFSQNLNFLREAIGLSQHHRGIMGVSNQNNADYFSRLLYQTFNNATEAMSNSLNKIILKKTKLTKLNFKSCVRLNISECRITEENEKFIVTVYNPSSQHVDYYVRVPVTKNNYEVRTGKDVIVSIQIVNIQYWISTMPTRKSKTDKELIFRATEVPPLGFKSFYVSAINATGKKQELVTRKSINLRINNITGKIEAIQRNRKIYPFSQELVYYSTYLSRNSVFKPKNGPMMISNDVRFRMINDGELVTEYEQIFGTWAFQIIRIYKEEEFIEFNWVIGPIPFSFTNGKEIVSKFVTNIKNGKVFYSDDNGRGLKKRKPISDSEFESPGDSIARNYRPVNSHISICDFDHQLHVFNDRVQGGTSAFDGELELMIHRRLLAVMMLNRREDLNERDYNGGMIATGQHWVFMGSSRDSKLNDGINKFAARSHWEPWLFFAKVTDVSYDTWKLNYVTEFSALNIRMPKNLRILTLEPWRRNQLLLRLENVGQVHDLAIQVNLQAMFSELSVTGAREVALAGSAFKSPSPKIQKFATNPVPQHATDDKLTSFEVSVNPTEIKTFIIDIEF